MSAQAGLLGRWVFGGALAALLIGAAAPAAIAQPGATRNVPNALQGFQQNRGQPVQIEAASLEVRDKDKVATFSGNVKVVQGDTVMRCKSLTVFYEQQGQAQAQAGGAPMKAASPGPGGSSSISRLEARGGVSVTQKDQVANGDTGLFDMKANTVTLQGNVVVSQGANIMRGERLVVDLNSGVSRVEAGKGPVKMLLNPSSQSGPDASPSPFQRSKPAQRPNAPN
jgi:lipopolysaccharide export system protein LptA